MMTTNSSLVLRNMFMMFRSSLKNFLQVNMVINDEKKKGIFLLSLHEELEKLLRSLCVPLEPAELSYDELMKKLEQVLRPDDLLLEYTAAEIQQQQLLPPHPVVETPSDSGAVPDTAVQNTNNTKCTIKKQYNILGNLMDRGQTAKNPLPYKLRPALFTFCGRDKYLGRLHETFDKHDCNVIVLHGFSGVGKSELANQYAWKNTQRYQNNIIWINANLLKAEFSSLAGELDVNTKRTELAQPLDRPMCQVIKEIYSQLREKGDCLLVLDDVLTKNMITEFLPDDQHKNMHVLITSPYAHWEGIHTIINLLPLTYNESEQILIAALDNKLDLETQTEDFQNLVKIVNGIPLAVQICAAYISNEFRVFEENFRLSSYVIKLETEKENYEKEILQKSISQSPEQENEKTIYASFLTTLDKISVITKSSKLLPNILEILNVCAYLNSEVIPLSLLQKICEIKDENLTRAIRVLVDFSLINKDNGHQVRMHKLIQDVVILNQKKTNNDSKWYKKVFEYFLKCDESDENQIISVLSHVLHYQQLIVQLYSNNSYQNRLLKLLVTHDCDFILKHIFEQVKNPKKIKKLVKDNNLLHVAVRNNRTQLVDTLLMYEDRVDRPDENGLSPLMVAAARGLKDVTARLLASGARLVITEPTPAKFIFRPFRQDHIEVIDMNYLDDPSSLTWTDSNGDTLLHLAARRGLVELCKHRVTTPGCDLNAPNTKGDISIHLAAEHGHAGICQVLLDSRCSDEVMNNDGWYPIHVAAKEGHVEVVKMFIGKNPASAIWLDKRKKFTPVLLAAGAGHIPVLRYLFTVEGMTVDTPGGYLGLTALMEAAAWGQIETVRWLLKHGASIQVRDTHQWTALYYASRNGNTNAVAIIAAAPGCDVNALDENDRSPLYVAAVWGHLGVVKVLIDAKAEIDLQNKEGCSPLHGAASENHLAVVQALINSKANIKLQTKAGLTPLQLAKRWKNLELERVLTP